MVHLVRLIIDFIQRHWELFIGAILLPVFLFTLQRQAEKKRQRIEGRQYYRKAVKVFDQAHRLAQRASPPREGSDSMDLYEDVIDLCWDALDLHYREAEVYFLMGRAYYEKEQRRDALMAFQMALRENHYHYEARYNLAQTYVDLRDDRQAVQEFERVALLKADDEKTLKLKHGAKEWLELLADCRNAPGS